MDTMESCVPPGFRFHPTDEELVGYYLKKKVASQKIDLDVIRDIDLYRIEPWDLQDRCRIGYEEQNEWYFFSHKDKKYPTGTRTNRATLAGFWKATGRDKAVYDKSKLMGMRKTLVFYKGRAPNGQKTDWIMHEYRLESDENGSSQEEGWVVCRAFKKKATTQSKNNECWDSSYVYDEPSGVSSVIDPIHEFVSRQSQSTSYFPKSLLCKREIDSKALSNFNIEARGCSSSETPGKLKLGGEDCQSLVFNNFMNQSTSVDDFLQLPQLESPSQVLPSLKRMSSSSISLVSQSNNTTRNSNNKNKYTSTKNHEDDCYVVEKVNDWRALDKFVASQLCQDSELQGKNRAYSEGVPRFSSHEESSNFEFEALFLLQGSNNPREDDTIEGSKSVSGFLNPSASDIDNIGIGIFDK